MDSILQSPPAVVQQDLDALNDGLTDAIPKKRRSNLLIGTWNIRKFGGLTKEWLPKGDYSPKRDLRSLRIITDIISRFDVMAIQETSGDLTALLDAMQYLGSHWSFLMTDVTLGSAGNNERLAYIFDTRRVQPSGLACEVVIPPEWVSGNDPKAVIDRQFVRTPYGVSFRAGEESFILLTAHIDYGDQSSERIPELRAIAQWMYDWAKRSNRIHHNLLVLGDFNIDRQGDALWQAFTSTNLFVPEDLQNVKRSIFIKEGEDPRTDKFYDQIAWFNSSSGAAQLQMEYLRGGSFDFLPYIFRDQTISRTAISHRVSDHYPLWVEFGRKLLP